MNFVERFLGKNIIYLLVLMTLGLLLIFIGYKYINAAGIGIIIVLISVIGLIREINLRYYIKIRKNTKEFKSNDEKFIANYFDMKKIKYLYEKELKVDRVLHPDFFLPEFDVYVEYWGRWPGDFDYRKECDHKRKLYKEYDIKLVELYPDNLASINQLDWKFTERLLAILKRDRS